MDLRKYEVDLPDGVVDEYYHNILSDNLLSQIDKEGKESILMEEIWDHKIEKFISGSRRRVSLEKNNGSY